MQVENFALLIHQLNGRNSESTSALIHPMSIKINLELIKNRQGKFGLMLHNANLRLRMSQVGRQINTHVCCKSVLHMCCMCVACISYACAWMAHTGSIHDVAMYVCMRVHVHVACTFT